MAHVECRDCPYLMDCSPSQDYAPAPTRLWITLLETVDHPFQDDQRNDTEDDSVGHSAAFQHLGDGRLLGRETLVRLHLVLPLEGVGSTLGTLDLADHSDKLTGALDDHGVLAGILTDDHHSGPRKAPGGPLGVALQRDSATAASGTVPVDPRGLRNPVASAEARDAGTLEGFAAAHECLVEFSSLQGLSP